MKSSSIVEKEKLKKRKEEETHVPPVLLSALTCASIKRCLMDDANVALKFCNKDVGVLRRLGALGWGRLTSWHFLDPMEGHRSTPTCAKLGCRHTFTKLTRSCPKSLWARWEQRKNSFQNDLGKLLHVILWGMQAPFGNVSRLLWNRVCDNDNLGFAANTSVNKHISELAGLLLFIEFNWYFIFLSLIYIKEYASWDETIQHSNCFTKLCSVYQAIKIIVVHKFDIITYSVVTCT